MILADSQGRLLESNPAFEKLIGVPPNSLRRIDDLPAYFAGSDDLARRLKSLRQTKRSWRGDVTMQTDNVPDTPLHLRADAIVARDERVLGFVLMFTDLTESRAAESARRRFQQSLVSNRRKLSSGLETGTQVKVQGLISQVIENGQLAALEVTESADSTNMGILLEGIRNSVERCAEVLERLTFDATQVRKP